MVKPNANNLSLTEHHHLVAFSLCVAHADRFVVERGRPNEVATLVAENIPERERLLRGAFRLLKKQPLSLTMEHGSSAVAPEPATVTNFSISRIRDVPHFVAKQESPFLWIADACAFSYTRYLSGGSFGAELIAPIAVPSFEQLCADKTRVYASLIAGGPAIKQERQA